MFSKEGKLEIERLKSEVENYQSKLKVKSMEYEQLQDKYVHKNNELFDMISVAFTGFKKIVDTAERNDFRDQPQKIRKMKEEAEDMRNYFAQLTIDTPILMKNRTTTTYQSNK